MLGQALSHGKGADSDLTLRHFFIKLNLSQKIIKYEQEFQNPAWHSPWTPEPGSGALWDSEGTLSLPGGGSGHR